MKSIVYLFAILISSGAFAQSDYYTSVVNNPYGEYQFLYELPWDHSQLIQVEKEYVASPPSHSVYKLETIVNGVSSPYFIPFCADISSEPLFLDDGILATGTTPLNGVECVFFDGNNTIEFDLNPGSDNSDPVIVTVGDEVFVIANDGNVRQLYKFDKINKNLTKITISPIDINGVCAVWGDDIYFTTVFNNTAFSQDEYSLNKASFNNGVYTFSNVRSVTIPFGVDRFVQWDSPVVKWNKLYLTEANSSYVSGVLSDLEVISVDDNNQVEVVHQMAQTELDFIELFEWDDALWAYVQNSNQLFVCRDALSFALDSDTGSKLISDEHVAGNNKLFLDLYIPSIDDHEIVAHYGTLQSIYVGDHVHFLMEENEILYLYDWKWYDSSSIVLIHTAFDGVEEVYIDQSGGHSPVRNASLIHDGEFTFLFAYDFADVDVLKLTGSPSAGVDEPEIEMSVYPNPISVGEVLTMRALRDGEVELINTSGNVLKQFEITNGVTQVGTASLSPGVYFISFMNRVQRIVVK